MCVLLKHPLHVKCYIFQKDPMHQMQNRTLFSAISLTRGHKHVVNTTLIMGSYGYWVQVLSSPYRIRLCPSQLQQKLGWIADKWADKHAV